jgi:hypothetical protein
VLSVRIKWYTAGPSVERFLTLRDSTLVEFEIQVGFELRLNKFEQMNGMLWWSRRSCFVHRTYPGDGIHPMYHDEIEEDMKVPWALANA